MIKRQIAHSMQLVTEVNNRYTVGWSKTNTHTHTHKHVLFNFKERIDGYYVVLEVKQLRHVCPSVLIEQLISNWTDFHEIFIFGYFFKYFVKIQVPLKSHMNIL